MARFVNSKIITTAALVIVTACADACAASSRPPAGWYDATTVSGDTGDEDGLRLKLRYVSGAPQITFWWCEGECFARPTHDLSIAGDRISFVADDVLVEPGGKQETHRYQFTGTFKEGALLLGSPGFWKTERLKFHEADARDD